MTHTVSGLKKTMPGLYNSWRGMRNRCMSKNRADAHCYALKGIEFAPEWDNIVVFKDWALAAGYREGLTLDRIDGNKGYSPDNCRWVDRKVQARNLSKNVLLTCNGETHCISEWAEKIGISASLLYARVFRLGWDLAKAINTPVGVISPGPKARCSR